MSLLRPNTLDRANIGLKIPALHLQPFKCSGHDHRCRAAYASSNSNDALHLHWKSRNPSHAQMHAIFMRVTLSSCTLTDIITEVEAPRALKILDRICFSDSFQKDDNLSSRVFEDDTFTSYCCMKSHTMRVDITPSAIATISEEHTKKVWEILNP